MTNFISKHNILFQHQYGFRSQHSTIHALLHLINQISSSIDNKKVTVGIFLDLSKAFDTVNHQILLNKLEHYGFRGITLQWIKNYLKDRKQFVKYKTVTSEYRTIRCGVPKRSILGPLLFLIYINDIAQISNLLNFILYADDTSAFIEDKDLNMLN